MKKLISLAVFLASVTLFTGCDNMDKPSPLDTRAPSNQMGGSGNPNIPLNEFADPNSNMLAERDSGFEGAANADRYDNPNPEDLVATIYFGFDQYAVAQSERAKVKAAVSELKANENLKVVLVAHTDWYGTEEYNLALSDKRGASVLTYFTGDNIKNSRVEIIARGKTCARANVSKQSQEAKHDRRVDIVRVR